MQDMLGEAYPAFLHSYDEERYQALRVNTLKGTVDEFLKRAPFFKDCVPLPVLWEENGFYYEPDMAPGKHPLHEAGVYYIQEPSAMAPAVYLEAEPGERVLDLCAAPGGKTTQIASYMQGEGLLVCSEIHPARAKVLSENVERMGIKNALVLNETPQHLMEAFGAYFDRILVDAPCSGEGMFRKNEEACGEWSPANVQLCADRQDGILDCADGMLRPGGRLVYSTCTFSLAENEGSIARFLERHPEYQLIAVKKYDGLSEGGLKHTVRLFPHRIKGEGHFFAVLQKSGEIKNKRLLFPANGLQKGICIKDVPEFAQFQQETLHTALVQDAEDCLLRFGDQIYRIPKDMPSLKGLKVLRAGLHLGTLKKNRFEPAHALALALEKEDVKRSVELINDDAAKAYLKGMTLNYNGEKGWYLMTYQGYSIGWGKLAGQVMKNHYPKGLRR